MTQVFAIRNEGSDKLAYHQRPNPPILLQRWNYAAAADVQLELRRQLASEGPINEEGQGLDDAVIAHGKTFSVREVTGRRDRNIREETSVLRILFFRAVMWGREQWGSI